MEYTKESLRSLAGSRLRQDILKSLETPMRLSELRRAIGANAPNTSARAKELEAMGLVEKERGEYYITSFGKIIRERLKLLSDTIESFELHRHFWERIMPHISESTISRIHLFKDAKLHKSDDFSPVRAKNHIIHIIDVSRTELLVALPNRVSYDITQALENAKNRGVQITFIQAQGDKLHNLGMIISENTTSIFTGLLDMALSIDNCLMDTPSSFILEGFFPKNNESNQAHQLSILPSNVPALWNSSASIARS